MEWTRDDIKNYFVTSKITKVLLHNKETGIQLTAVMDLSDNSIEFIIEDGVDIIYNSSFEIKKAIDKFYDKVEEIKCGKER
jgi:hypothetical protein